MAEFHTPYYAGKEYARMDLCDGGLLHAVGASNYQVLRANRAHPELAEGLGFTYNHAPMLTYWRGSYYLEYLTNPVDEHTGPGASLLARSRDGVTWDEPVIVFPFMKAPAGEYRCADGQTLTVPEDRDACMHQRMGFFHSSDDRLLACGFYGHVATPYQCPWVNYGIGRVVREIYEDGSMGPVYFVRILEDSGWREELLPFASYKRSGDAGFVAACEELLEDKLTTQQWAEEHGNRDPYVHLKTYAGAKGDGANQNPYEAFCWYHVDEQTVIALWKHAIVGISRDGGDTWEIQREPSFVTSGGKMWGQRTADSRFAIAYLNSLGSEHRYPLTVVTSEDGIRFDQLAVAFGELPPRRYDGLFKDYGPQYLRGICEGHKDYPMDALWLCHSVNKEDIWVTRVPLPIHRQEEAHVDEGFDPCSLYVEKWNIYSPKWAPIDTVRLPDGSGCLRLCDREPADYARAMRCFPQSGKIRVELELMSSACYKEALEIELASPNGTPACLVRLGGDSVTAQTTSVHIPLCAVSPECVWHTLTITADCGDCRYSVFWDGQLVTKSPLTMIQKVNSLQRIILRTKPARKAPGMNVRPMAPDMENADLPVAKRTYYLRHLKTETL